MYFLGNSHPNMPSEKGELVASVVVALSRRGLALVLPRLASAQACRDHGHGRTLRSFSESGCVDPLRGDMTNSIRRRIVPIELGSLTYVASDFKNARRFRPR